MILLKAVPAIKTMGVIGIVVLFFWGASRIAPKAIEPIPTAKATSTSHTSILFTETPVSPTKTPTPTITPVDVVLDPSEVASQTSSSASSASTSVGYITGINACSVGGIEGKHYIDLFVSQDIYDAYIANPENITMAVNGTSLDNLTVIKSSNGYRIISSTSPLNGATPNSVTVTNTATGGAETYTAADNGGSFDCVAPSSGGSGGTNQTTPPSGPSGGNCEQNPDACGNGQG